MFCLCFCPLLLLVLLVQFLLYRGFIVVVLTTLSQT